MTRWKTLIKGEEKVYATRTCGTVVNRTATAKKPTE